MPKYRELQEVMNLVQMKHTGFLKAYVHNFDT